jgi:SAM-dependent methyltransferase
MRAEEQMELERMEQGYWWHVGRRHLVEHTLLKRFGDAGGLRICDVGCGTGANLELLGRFGTAVGVEPEGPGLERCRARGLGDDAVVAGDACALPFDDESFDLVTSFDVLEHIEDDSLALRELARVLRPNGYLLVTVPAYRFLWSIHDESLGHRRRYMASELHSKLNTAGFAVIKRSYAVSFTLPGILGYRIAQGLFPSLASRGASYVDVPPLVNRALAASIKLESRLLDAFDLPVGTSIFAFARKGQNQASR